MTHRYARQELDVLRGFDLGDDERLLASLRAAVAGGEAGPADHGLLAVILHRRGEAVDALPHYAEAFGDPALLTPDRRYVHAHALLEAGRLGEASARFEEVARDDELATLGRHGLALVALAEGRATEAVDRLRALARELADDDGLDPAEVLDVWMDLADALVAAGRADEAVAALVAAEDHDNVHTGGGERLRTHRLRLLLRLGRHDDASAALAAMPAWFADVVDADAGLAPLHRPRSPPDIRWSAALAPWVRALQEAPELADALQWLDEAGSHDIAAVLRARYQGDALPLGTIWWDESYAAACEDAPHAVPLALLPEIRSRQSGIPGARPVLLLDDRDPSRPYLALHGESPGFLWIPIGTTPAEVATVLDWYYPVRSRSRVELPKTVRAFMGYHHELAVPDPYSGDLVDPHPHHLARHWAMSRWVLPEFWGSSRDEDPWPDFIPPQHGYGMKIAAFQRRVRQQAPGGPFQWSRRTWFSRSILTQELHQASLWVWEVRYRPHPWSAPVAARLAERLGLRFPPDLPVDVMGAVLGFDFSEPRDLEAGMEEVPSPVPYIHVLAALYYQDLPALAGLLRRFLASDDPEVQGACFNVASVCNLPWVHRDILVAGASHPQIEAVAAELFPWPLAPEAANEHGEPVALDIPDDDDGLEDE